MKNLLHVESSINLLTQMYWNVNLNFETELESILNFTLKIFWKLLLGAIIRGQYNQGGMNNQVTN